MSLPHIRAAPRRLHRQLEAVEAQIPGKGRVNQKSSEAGVNDPTAAWARCWPVLCRGCRNKGSKIKARPLGQPQVALRKLKGEKGPSCSTWKQV